MSTDAVTANVVAANEAPAEQARADAARIVATVHLPASLVALFPGALRRLELEAATVAGLVDSLNARWPGMRDRICAPGPRIRQHINIFVDGERATLATGVKPGSTVHVIPAVSGG